MAFAITPLQAAITASLNGVTPNQASSVNGGAQFGQMLTKMLEKTSDSQNVSDDLSQRLQMDDPKVSVEQTVLASNEASLNFEFALQTRNKLMKAYQDLMSTPV